MRGMSGDMTQQLRSVTALTKDLCLAHTIYNSRSRVSEPLFGSVPKLYTCGQAGMQAETAIHKTLKLKTIFKI